MEDSSYDKDKTLIDRLSSVLSFFGICGTPVIVVVIIYEVVSRYVFVNPTLWANELSLWIAGAIYLLGGLYAMRDRSHIRITILYDMVPQWARRTFDIISTLLLGIYVFALFWGGSVDAWRKMVNWETFGTAWDPPIPATIKPLLLLSFILIVAQALSNLVVDWNSSNKVKSPETSPKAPGKFPADD